jgi:hypothetical protein
MVFLQTSSFGCSWSCSSFEITRVLEVAEKDDDPCAWSSLPSEQMFETAQRASFRFATAPMILQHIE